MTHRADQTQALPRDIQERLLHQRQLERNAEARRLDELKARLRVKVHMQWVLQVRQRAS
jgi:hypothetical protein